MLSALLPGPGPAAVPPAPVQVSVPSVPVAMAGPPAPAAPAAPLSPVAVRAVAAAATMATMAATPEAEAAPAAAPAQQLSPETGAVAGAVAGGPPAAERPDAASLVAAMSTSVDEQSVRAAYEDVRADTSDTEWAVFKFEEQSVVCAATGVGFDSFRAHFADDERAFGFIRIQMGDEMSKRQKFMFLTWVGPRVSVIRRAKMSIDKAMVKSIIKNFAVELQVETQAEINEDYFREELARVGGANYGTGFRD